MTGLLICQYSLLQKLSSNKIVYEEANSLFLQSRLSTTIVPYTKLNFIQKGTMMTGSGGGGPKLPPKLPPGNSGPKSETQLGSYTSSDLAKAPRLTEPVVDPYATKPEYAPISPGKFNDVPLYKPQPGVINIDKSIIENLQEQRPDFFQETHDKEIVKAPKLQEKNNITDDFFKDESETKTVPQEKEFVGINVLEEARDAKGELLKSHEQGKGAHTFIAQYDAKAGTYTVDHMLTSAKNHKITKQQNPVIDDKINFQGGTKSQRMTDLETGRLYLEYQKGKVFEEVPKATAYMQDPDRKAKIKSEIEKTPTKHKTPRQHKDDPELYTPDGISHQDDDNIQREPQQSTVKTLSDNFNEDDSIPHPKNSIDDVY